MAASSSAFFPPQQTGSSSTSTVDGKKASTLEALTAIILKNPDSLEGRKARYERGLIYHEKKRYKEAVDDFTVLIKQGKNTLLAYRRRGLAHYKNGHLREACSDFTYVIDHSKDINRVTVARHDRGLVYAEAGHTEEAIADFDEVIRHGGKDQIIIITACYNRGLLYYDRGLLDGKREAFQCALADFNRVVCCSQHLSPVSVANIHYRLGAIHYECGRFDKAMEHLDQALSCQALSSQEKRDFESLLAKVYKEELNRLTVILGKNPTDKEAYLKRGNIHVKQGRFGRAMSDFNEVIRLDPQDLFARSKRARTYSLCDKFELAIVDYDYLIAHDQDAARLAMSYFRRALIYYKQEAFDRAIENYSAAILRRSQFVEAYLNRGNAYRAQAQFDLAINDYHQALMLGSPLAYGNFKTMLDNIRWLDRISEKKLLSQYSAVFAGMGTPEAQNMMEAVSARIKVTEKHCVLGHWTQPNTLSPEEQDIGNTVTDDKVFVI